MFYFIIDILGTIAFAISGVLVAMEKKLDIFGVFIIAFVTAVGGGTLRDMLIGSTPVFWMRDYSYISMIIGTVIFAVLFAKHLHNFRKTLLFFDAIGIGLFTMVGVEKGLAYDLLPIMCIALGTITACFGGVIRDILCNQIPAVFSKEIYATPCILGGIIYFGLMRLPIENAYAYSMAIMVIIVVRLLALRFGISLPNIYRK